MIEIFCSCGKAFEVRASRLKHGRGRCCSRACQYRENREKLSKNTVLIKCLDCSKEFLVCPSNADRQFCSKSCAYANKNVTKTRSDKGVYKKNLIITCAYCGNNFDRKSKKLNKYCSDACRKCVASAKISGENNYFYKNGNSEHKRSHRGAFWNLVRIEVYKRDNYTCQECGVHCISRKEADKIKTYSSVIQCHHVIPYHKGGTNSLDNLLTLCLSCHLKVEQRIKSEY